MNTDPIQRVQFSVLSSDEVRRRSACEVTSVDPYSNGAPCRHLQRPAHGRRLRAHCATCHNDNKECPGHFGHIELAVPLFNAIHVDLRQARPQGLQHPLPVPAAHDRPAAQGSQRRFR
jgi:DNA-directed RNA polymerase beta' subunit